jgi:hypothetical protein
MHIIGLLLQNIFGVRFLKSKQTCVKGCADRNLMFGSEPKIRLVCSMKMTIINAQLLIT